MPFLRSSRGMTGVHSTAGVVEGVPRYARATALTSAPRNDVGCVRQLTPTPFGGRVSVGKRIVTRSGARRLQTEGFVPIAGTGRTVGITTALGIVGLMYSPNGNERQSAAQ